jgi:predicted hydrocarbon binding protein
MALKFNIEELSNTKRDTLGRDIDVTVFRLIRFMDLERYLGRGAHGVIYECGRELGQALNPKSVEDVVKFCEEYKIGKVEIVNKEPLQIRVYECISCSGLPNVGETLCWFEGGFIAGCLEKILNKKVRVKETHCAGLGYDYCQFEVKFL